MKKLLIVILFLLVFVSGCLSNEVVPNHNQITLVIEDEFAEKMNYDVIPDFTFEFEGTLNTIKHVRKSNYTIFASNDDFHLSDEITKLFERYADQMVIEVVEVVEQPYTRINELDEQGKVNQLLIEPDNGKLYLEVAYIALENGLKLTLDYRRFEYQEQTYYVWRYQSNISMTLNYPLMVILENDKKEIVILTLPNLIKYQVGTGLVVDRVMKNNSYLEDSKYSFQYLDDFETVEEKQAYVADYYLNEMNGQYVGDEIHFEYIGVRFAVVFEDLFFVLRYLEKVS